MIFPNERPYDETNSTVSLVLGRHPFHAIHIYLYVLTFEFGKKVKKKALSTAYLTQITALTCHVTNNLFNN